MIKCKLGELLEVKRGASLSGQYYATNGKFIRLTLGNFNYPNGGFKENIAKEDIFFIGEVKPEFILKKGDIITPLTEQVAGLLGETARIPESNKYIQSGDIGLVIPDETKLNKQFAYYLVSSPIVKKQLGAAAQQTKIRHTSPDKIKDCEVWIPDLKYQEKASRILDNINEKISNNNKIILELETMAKTIYDYWFLQYEFPNEDGNPYKSSGGKMIYNDELKREIPLGWKIENIINNSISSVIMPGIVKFDGKKNYLATANVNNSNIQDGEWITYNNRESRANMQPVLNSVWFAKMKNSIKHITFTKGSNTLIDKYILSTGFLGIKCKETSLPYIYCFIYSENFEKQKDILAHGATQEAVNNKDLENIKIQIPEDTILSQFSNYVYDYLEMQNILIQENQELTNLRDYLLPLLMNGQVSFKN